MVQKATVVQKCLECGKTTMHRDMYYDHFDMGDVNLDPCVGDCDTPTDHEVINVIPT